MERRSSLNKIKAEKTKNIEDFISMNFNKRFLRALLDDESVWKIYVGKIRAVF
jgi:hypothetical protein